MIANRRPAAARSGGYRNVPEVAWPRSFDETSPHEVADRVGDHLRNILRLEALCSLREQLLHAALGDDRGYLPKLAVAPAADDPGRRASDRCHRNGRDRQRDQNLDEPEAAQRRKS